MRIARIRNQYLYKGNSPKGFHYYAVYYDRSKKRYNAVGLTHLYVKDKKRFSQIDKGYIKRIQLSQFDVPSGVRDGYFSETISGTKINLKDKNVTYLSKRHLSKKQASFIRSFAKNDWNK